MCALVQSNTAHPAASTGANVPLRVLRWHALGTQCEVQYACADSGHARAFENEATGWVAAFEAKYSRFRPDSLISRINAAAGGDWVPVDPEMDAFLDLSGSLHQLTGGVLDVTALPLMRLWDYKAATPRIPAPQEVAAALRLVGWSKVQRAPGRVRLPLPGMALDFGGWGKEYAVDMIAQLARRHGIEQALVDFGHDLCAVGAAPGKPGWHIGLEDPAQPGVACWGSIAARDCGVASSGDYIRGFTQDGRRYGHIIDPRNGRPVANGCRQVTVVARTCVQAGVLSTAVFILGPVTGLRLVEEIMGVEAAIVADTARHQTKGFNRYVVAH
ncbi:MAG: FAD:protein FMN transferase [Opitutae bacterium]|nr:FAD:protein FMN transferase [Opitutae bacterium]